jgi:hypothetical protein
MITVLRMPQVVQRTGLSAPTIYRRMAEGTFPPSRMRIGERARGSAVTAGSVRVPTRPKPVVMLDMAKPLPTPPAVASSGDLRCRYA